jgi:hypothetical protein
VRHRALARHQRADRLYICHMLQRTVSDDLDLGRMACTFTRRTTVLPRSPDGPVGIV